MALCCIQLSNGNQMQGECSGLKLIVMQKIASNATWSMTANLFRRSVLIINLSKLPHIHIKYRRVFYSTGHKWTSLIKEKLFNLKLKQEKPLKHLLNPFVSPGIQEPKESVKLDDTITSTTSTLSLANKLKSNTNHKDWAAIISEAESTISSSSFRLANELLPEDNEYLIAARLERDYFASLFSKLKSELGDSRHPLLNTINCYYLQAGGKRVRPLIVLLLSQAFSSSLLSTKNPWSYYEKLAEIAELMHTASLMHDDVIDGSHSRRSILSAPVLFGNKAAILSGDYLLATASIKLAQLGSPPVIELMSQVICDLARGEIMQLDVPPKEKFSLEYYLEKSFRKTACLIAKCCKSAAILAGLPEDIQKASFEFGNNFGMAFQIIDDVLDYEVSCDEFGKSSAHDLNNGNLTAPFLFALQEDSSLNALYNGGFSRPNDIQTAFEIITTKTNALQKSKDLVKELQQKALNELEVIQKYLNSTYEELEKLKELTKTISNRRR